MAELERRRRQRKTAVDVGTQYRFYGRNAEFFECREPEFMLSGPAETGKTLTALSLLNALASTFPGLQGAIVRKVRADMDGTVLQTFKERILGNTAQVRPFGGEKVEFYDYANGSRLWVGGMDKPGKVLSGERDAIYINQAEETELTDWETLLTRATGRAGHLRDESGNAFGLLFGDCNPGSPTHWIWSRQLSGQLKFFESRHEHNPILFDQQTGHITEQGRRTMERLGRLTGFRKSRLKDGLWVQAEGIIFDTWSEGPSGNVTEAADYEPGAGSIVWALDDGYAGGSAPDTRGLDPHTGGFVADAHPRAIFLVQLKPDGHLDIFAESYHCLKLSDVHIQEVKDWSREQGWPDPEFAVHGPGTAEIRGRLMAAGIYPRMCSATVEESIKEARTKFGADANGWRQIRVHPRCKHLRSEMVSYAYDAKTGKPVKAFDHGPDAVRYLSWVLRFQQKEGK